MNTNAEAETGRFLEAELNFGTPIEVKIGIKLTFQGQLSDDSPVHIPRKKSINLFTIQIISKHKEVVDQIKTALNQAVKLNPKTGTILVSSSVEKYAKKINLYQLSIDVIGTQYFSSLVRHICPEDAKYFTLQEIRAEDYENPIRYSELLSAIKYCQRQSLKKIRHVKSTF